MIEQRLLNAFIKVESGGKGFDPKTGKLLIQFEPAWFKKISHNAPNGAWSANKIERQSEEWTAFNNAYSIDPDAAMCATSIGLPQIMGFHWKRLGYANVGAMWDDFKAGEPNQVAALSRFIETDARLLRAFNAKDWHTIASIYNGASYEAQAKRLNITPYNIQLKNAYEASGNV